jgi:hypothetical protein
VHRGLLLFLCLLLLALSGCAAMSPPKSLTRNTLAETAIISAETADVEETEYSATLYFRYLDTKMLSTQERVISIPKNVTREKAIIQALLSGPGASVPQLTALFQPGVTILSTQAVDGVLFVTFNDALLGRYDDEPADLTSPYWKTEAPLRRSLAMAALVASLTETGEFQSIQVLVRGQTFVTTSMRLNMSYFLTGEDGLSSPLTRDETKLLTQTNTARIILEAWHQGDVKTLYLFTAIKDPDTGIARPAEQTVYAELGQAGTLIAYSISAGSVSPNGQTAILCADITVHSSSNEIFTHTAWPVMLCRENGIWKIPYAKLTDIMVHR